MIFFDRCMEAVFSAMNVRRSGPEYDKQTYIDMTVLVEIPSPDVVAAIDVGLVALLFDNARMAVKSAVPSNQVYFPRQDLALATRLFESVTDDGIALFVDAAVVNAKTLFPADESGYGAKMKLQFSFVSPSKRDLALLAELIGEPVWFIGEDSATQDLPKKKKKSDDDGLDVLEGQEKLFHEETIITLESGGKKVTATAKQMDRALHAIK